MKQYKIISKNKSLYGLIIICILWLIVHWIVKSSIVPSPFEAVAIFIKLLKEDMLIHIGASLLRILIATFVSLGIGVPLGLFAGTNKKADIYISPVVYAIYPIPKIAFLPVFMLMFGLGDLSKIILIITIIVFQILLATRDGVKEIPIQLFYSVKSLGLSNAQFYKHLILPAVLPKIISGIRVSVGIGISVLFFSENFATSYGVGYYIMHMWAIMKYKEMFAGIIGISLLGFSIFKVIDLIEKKLCAWMFVNK